MKQFIPYIVIIFLIGWITYDIVREDDVKVVSDTTETTIDSTVVDSLQQRIEYLEAIDEPDTVRTVVKIPVPISSEDGLNRYEPTYSDSMITAKWGLTVQGTIVEEMEFEYFLKRQMVREDRITTLETKYITTTRTITQRIQPRGYLSIGAFTGAMPIDNEILFQFGGTLKYTNSDRRSIYVNYDFLNQGVTVGFTAPLSLRSLFR